MINLSKSLKPYPDIVLYFNNGVGDSSKPLSVEVKENTKPHFYEELHFFKHTDQSTYMVSFSKSC